VVIEGKEKRNTPLNPLLIEGRVIAGKGGRGEGGEQAGKRQF